MTGVLVNILRRGSASKFSFSDIKRDNNSNWLFSFEITSNWIGMEHNSFFYNL